MEALTESPFTCLLIINVSVKITFISSFCSLFYVINVENILNLTILLILFYLYTFYSINKNVLSN